MFSTRHMKSRHVFTVCVVTSDLRAIRIIFVDSSYIFLCWTLNHIVLMWCYLFPHVEFPGNVGISVIFITGPAVELSLNDLLLNRQVSGDWKHAHTHTHDTCYFPSTFTYECKMRKEFSFILLFITGYLCHISMWKVHLEEGWGTCWS